MISLIGSSAVLSERRGVVVDIIERNPHQCNTCFVHDLLPCCFSNVFLMGSMSISGEQHVQGEGEGRSNLLGSGL